MAIHHWDNSRCAMSGVRFNLNFGMPDARKSHRPYVGLGSKPEVSDGHENVGCWGKSGSRFRAA